MTAFFSGAVFAVKGIALFYKDTSLWKFTIGPWLALLAVYTGIVWMIFHLAHKLTFFLTSRMNDYPEFLQKILAGSLTVVAILLAAMIILTTLSTLFEIFGSLFFDKLIEEFEKKYYGTEFPSIPVITQLGFTFQAAWFGVKTTVLFFIFLVISFFLPLAGQLLLVLIIGFRMAYALLFTPGFLRNRNISETRKNFSGRRMEVAGFGAAVYLIQLIPFSFPLTFPGILLGSVMLYNSPLPPKQNFLQEEE